eukprot:209572_1
MLSDDERIKIILSLVTLTDTIGKYNITEPGVIIFDYLKNDKLFLKLLIGKDKTYSFWKKLYGIKYKEGRKYKGKYGTNKGVEIVLNSPNIKLIDKFKLCNCTENAENSLLFDVWKKEDYKNSQTIIELFRYYKHLLIKLLTKQSNDNKPCIAFCSCVSDIELIFDIISDNNIFEIIFDQKINDFHEKIQPIIQKWKDYLRFDQLLTDINHNTESTEIDLSFCEYKTNPFVTVCELNKAETIKQLVKYIQNNSHKLMTLLSNESIEALFVNSNPKPLQLLILNNLFVSDKIKLKLLCSNVSNPCVLAVMDYIRNDRIQYIKTLKQYKNAQSIIHIMNNSVISDKDKLNLLTMQINYKSKQHTALN